MGFYESALADYDRMIELEPTDFRTRCHRARVLILMKTIRRGGGRAGRRRDLRAGGPLCRRRPGPAGRGAGREEGGLGRHRAGVRRRARRSGCTYYVSRVYAALGMKDRGHRQHRVRHRPAPSRTSTTTPTSSPSSTTRARSFLRQAARRAALRRDPAARGAQVRRAPGEVRRSVSP
ncbi:MAG: hypothetical protein MZU79_07210 [Anaerotruncus sp.]|nr:hypothetical protein [Anaerotruncus sp.]